MFISIWFNKFDFYTFFSFLFLFFHRWVQVISGNKTSLNRKEIHWKSIHQGVSGEYMRKAILSAKCYLIIVLLHFNANQIHISQPIIPGRFRLFKWNNLEQKQSTLVDLTSYSHMNSIHIWLSNCHLFFHTRFA